MAIILSCTLLFSMSVLTFASNEATPSPAVLSEMSDEELLAFLDSYEIEVTINKLPSVRMWIAAIESNPNWTLRASLTDLANLSNSVKSAVLDYYGPALSQSASTYALTYTLQDSVFYSQPSNASNYNCYAYAIGMTDSFHQPGFLSNFTLTSDNLPTTSIYQLAQYIKSDLQNCEYNFECVVVTTTRPTASTINTAQSALCVRKGSDGASSYDYHCMKFVPSENVWRHKPSYTAILTYLYMPTYSRVWTNEGYFNGVAFAPDITYDSTIYYVLYQLEHNYEAQYTGTHYHLGTKHYYEFEYICADCGDVGESYCESVSCSGPPCQLAYTVVESEEDIS